MTKTEPNYIKYGKILADKSNAKETVIGWVSMSLFCFSISVALMYFWGPHGIFFAVIGMAMIPHTMEKARKYRKAKKVYDDFMEATRKPWEQTPTQ